MIDESITLLREWWPGEDSASFAERVVRENIVGKTSRNRIRDLLSRIFFRRFPGPVANNLHTLLETRLSDRDLHLLLLYHTALADDLLYDFVTAHLFDLLTRGRVYMDTADGIQFINNLTAQGLITPPWSEQITMKTSRGLLAACRDFGLLEGHNRKQFAHLHLPYSVFLYIAYSLRDRELPASQILSHPDWRLFLLEEDQVERHLLNAHQNGDLRYEAAGGIKRLDWTWHDLRGLIAHLTEGAD